MPKQSPDPAKLQGLLLFLVRLLRDQQAEARDFCNSLDNPRDRSTIAELARVG